MYTVHITHTPQSTEALPLFDSAGQQQGTAVPVYPAQPIVEEVATVRVATLDIPALMALLYKTPRAKRSDAGKARVAK